MRDAIACGVVALLACIGLGLIVSNQPPAAYDSAGAYFGGVALPVATFFTRAGLFPVYATLCAFLIVLGFVRREWMQTILIPVIGLFVIWQVSDALKALLHRPRPAAWFIMPESSPSYPSGHAALATAFYGFWAYLALQRALPMRIRVAVVTAIAFFIVAVGWSRLALGAHYPSDLIGGYLLGVSALCFEIAVTLRAPKIRFEPPGAGAVDPPIKVGS